MKRSSVFNTTYLDISHCSSDSQTIVFMKNQNFQSVALIGFIIFHKTDTKENRYSIAPLYYNSTKYISYSIEYIVYLISYYLSEKSSISFRQGKNQAQIKSYLTW